MKGLIIKSPWIDYILANEKTWEIRGSATKIRGVIYLIKSGTSKVYGSVELVDSIKITQEQFNNSYMQHRISTGTFEELPYKQPYAWIMRNAIRYPNPISYKHPLGAVIWVNLDEKIIKIDK